VTASNTCAEPKRENLPAPRCEMKATVLTNWRTRRRTRPGTQAGRTTASYKVSAYHNKPGVNTRNLISLTGNEPAKFLVNVNSFVNTLSSDLKSNKVIVHSPRRHPRVLLRNINFHNLQVIDPLHDDQKVEIPLTVCCLNVQSL